MCSRVVGGAINVHVLRSWGGCSCAGLRLLCGDSAWHLCQLSKHNRLQLNVSQALQRPH